MSDGTPITVLALEANMSKTTQLPNLGIKKSNNKTYKVFGKTYSTKAEIYRAFGYNKDTIRRYIDKGFSVEESIIKHRNDGDNGRINHPTKVIVFGISFPSIRTALSYLGMPTTGNYRNHKDKVREYLEYTSIMKGWRTTEAYKEYIEDRRNGAQERYWDKWKGSLGYREHKRDIVVREFYKDRAYSAYRFDVICLCRHCNNVFIQDGVSYVKFCSDDCKKEHGRVVGNISRAKYRKENRRKYGRESSSNHKRRLKEGAIYTRGITAKKVAERDHMICQICRGKVRRHKGGYQEDGWTIGHIIAKTNGGDHTWGNVQCECHKCNTIKGTKDGGQLRLF